MANVEVMFNASANFTLRYNTTSKEFIDSFKSYKQSIDKTAEVEDMLIHVVFHVNRFGIESMVEGVGYIKIFGSKEKKEPYSGIEIKDDSPDFQIERW